MNFDMAMPYPTVRSDLILTCFSITVSPVLIVALFIMLTLEPSTLN